MRPAQLARLLFASSVLVMAWTQPLSAGDKIGKGKKELIARHEWTIAGLPDNEPEVAKQAALNKARDTLKGYLQVQAPRVHLDPSEGFLLSHLLSDEKIQRLKEGKEEGKWVVEYKMVVDDEKYREMIREDARQSKEERELRARTRMFGLGKFLSVVVAFLAALTGYLRLEEATKGYYTAWLRLAAISFVGAVGVGMWLAC
jgi:hypothetical protein